LSRTKRCPRAWEAEAVEDGRLAGADGASFERHAATCPTCAHEVEAIASLHRAMREIPPPEVTPLELRRMRVRLLQQAHARRIHSRPRPGRAWILAGITALVAIALVVAVPTGHFGSRRAIPARATASAAGPVFDVVNIAGAAVTSGTDGGVTRAVLSDGVAAFHVEHVAPALRFLVALPDGEIEVRGTRFVVSVAEGRTRSVDVVEGMVVLRLRGDAERQLGAGARWSAPAPASSPVAEAKELDRTQASRDATPAPRKAAPDAFPPAPAMPAPLRRIASETSPASAASSEAARPDARLAANERFAANERLAANERFASAMAAFGAASYAQADDLLASFALDFGGDARAEDASFLRAVARSRMGDEAGAASLAGAYLRSFPLGLRRREAEELTRAAGGVHVP